MKLGNLDLSSVIRQIKTFADAQPVHTAKEDTDQPDLNNTDLASFTVGVVLGSHLELPLAPVTIPATYFSSNHGIAVREVLSQINEGTMINVNQAYQAASRTFGVRYQAAFEAPDNFNMMLSLLSNENSVHSCVTDLLANDASLASLFNTLNTEITLKKQLGE